MKWTSEPPKKDGFYWVEFEEWDIHQQGPMVFEVWIDDGELVLCEPGGDFMRTPEQMEKEGYEGKIKRWSDEPIPIPEE